LGNEVFPLKLEDEFTGALATRKQDTLAILLFNYVNPEAATDYLSRNIAPLRTSERRAILNLIGTQRLEDILSRRLDLAKLRLTKRVKALLEKAQELDGQAKKFTQDERSVKIDLKGLKDRYAYQRYAVDSRCAQGCAFSPLEEKEIEATAAYSEILKMEPFSVHLIILKKKPAPEVAPAAEQASTSPLPEEIKPPPAENSGA